MLGSVMRRSQMRLNRSSSPVTCAVRSTGLANDEYFGARGSIAWMVSCASLGSLRPCLAQALPVGDAFDVADHDLHVVAFQEVGDEIEGGNVGFVAGGYDVVEADALEVGEPDHAEGEAPALRDEGDGAGLEMGIGETGPKAAIDAVVQVHGADAVGAQETHAGFVCRRLQLVFQLNARGAGFAETRRKNDRKGEAGETAGG